MLCVILFLCREIFCHLNFDVRLVDNLCHSDPFVSLLNFFCGLCLGCRLIGLNSNEHNCAFNFTNIVNTPKCHRYTIDLK